MSTKDAVGNGDAAKKEAAMQSLSTGAADSAESSARRTARAGARREPCMLNGHGSTKVGLEPGSIGKEPDVRAVRAGSTARDKRGQTLGCRGRDTLAGHGIVVARASSTAVDQTTFVVGGAGNPARVEGRIACRLHCQQRTAMEGGHDPEPILTDLPSHE